MKIKVGIVTAGRPDLQLLSEGRTLLRNQLIGKDFHWERTIQSILPGEIEILPQAGADGVTLINTLELEEYLAMVVGSEMNPAAPTEFLKCHAILSRSWVVGKILRCHNEGDAGKIETADTHIGWDDTADHHGFHVCADDHCQRYQGRNEISPEAADAIRHTAGMILTDRNGDIIDARFSKCCAGRSELFSTCWQDSEPEGIESVEDKWCDLSNIPATSRRTLLASILKDYDAMTTEDLFRWEERVDKAFAASRLRECFGIDLGERIEKAKSILRGKSGRIALMKLTGTNGKEINFGKELHIRRIFSHSHLKSSAFDIYDDGDTFLLRGKGWGHGVGLCQIGAANMALSHTCEDILAYYFPNTRITIFTS